MLKTHNPSLTFTFFPSIDHDQPCIFVLFAHNPSLTFTFFPSYPLAVVGCPPVQDTHNPSLTFTFFPRKISLNGCAVRVGNCLTIHLLPLPSFLDAIKHLRRIIANICSQSISYLYLLSELVNIFQGGPVNLTHNPSLTFTFFPRVPFFIILKSRTYSLFFCNLPHF